MGIIIAIAPYLVGLLAVLGLVLLALGLRGRGVSTATHCRNCRFDLTGVYPAHTTCPECGRDLTQRRATRRGLRRRRWVVLALGLLLLTAPAGVGVMAARGQITKTNIARALPTGVLISLAIEHPDRWLLDEARAELRARVAGPAGPNTARTITPAQTSRLTDALFTALEQLDFPDHAYHAELLDLAAARASPEVRRRYADFLLDRVTRTDLPWLDSWRVALYSLRDKGVIHDAEWDAMRTTLITPRLWCSSGEVVEPGEVFVLRVTYLADRLSIAPGSFLERPEPVTLVSRPNDPGMMLRVTRGGMGMPESEFQLGNVLIAGDRAGTEEFVVETWYDESMDDPRGIFSPEARASPGVLHARAALPFEVRPADPGVPKTLPPVEQWLKERLLPAVSAPMMGRSTRVRSTFHATIAVLAQTPTEQHELRLHGSLVVVEPDGARSVVGDFVVFAVDASQSTIWNGDDSSRSRSGSDPDGRSLKALYITIPKRCVLPGRHARAVLVFERVTLPDGRTHDTSTGVPPIEIDVPLDPEVSDFSW